tara:strand:- start:2045 stop:2725 length:681 start_codon:yes stop_codon:yes gene_type:complete
MGDTLKILVVDDDKDIVEILKYNLKNSGYSVKSANNGIEAIKKAKKFLPDVILMDVMMPEMSGIEACSEIKEINELSNTIIIFLSARSEDYTQISAYDAGADDYISKPIKPKVLLKKISNIAKKINSEKNLSQILNLGNIIINKEEYVVYKDKNEIILPRKAFELLFLLASKPERVFKREEIMNHVWGTQVVVGDRTIDVHIRKLREKIGEKHIRTIKGVGYKFKS